MTGGLARGSQPDVPSLKSVTPAQAGVQANVYPWIPAFAGMTTMEGAL
jgi:hypothetical protein